jgi:hypothetical protein
MEEAQTSNVTGNEFEPSKIRDLMEHFKLFFVHRIFNLQRKEMNFNGLENIRKYQCAAGEAKCQ